MSRESIGGTNLVSIEKIKLADIARLAGVSKSTVSFVLNGHAKKHRINAETVEKIKGIAAENDYIPSIYARALKSKKTYSIGLVIPDLANAGFAQISKRLEVMYRSIGHQLLIVSSEDDPEIEKSAIQNLLYRQVDLLYVATSMIDDTYLNQVNMTTPVVLFDRVFDKYSLASVQTDALQATRSVIANLVRGKKECVYIGGQMTLSTSKTRLEGYMLGLKDANIEVDKKNIFYRDYQPEFGYNTVNQLIEQRGEIPEAIFTASYSILEGVLRCLNEKGKLVQGVSIATFDNYSILDCLPISIDSIEQNSELIVDTLFSIGQDLLSGKKLVHYNYLLPAKVHKRSTL